MRMETMAIHVGQKPDPSTGSVSVPVYQTSTFEQDGIGQPLGYVYLRAGNPTREALETVLASLEGGRFGLAFASWGRGHYRRFPHALLKKGDHVIACDVLGLGKFDEDDLYGNLDWLCENQGKLKDRLFRRIYCADKPGLFLYDVTPSHR